MARFWLTIALWAFAAPSAWGHCFVVLEAAGRFHSPSAAEQFIEYLQIVLDNRTLSTADLEAWLQRLQTGADPNPVLGEATAYGPAFATAERNIAHERFEQFVDANQLDWTQIHQWARAYLDKMTALQQQIALASEKTQVPSYDPHFALLRPHLEAMTTPVTEGMWLRLMNRNPSAALFKPTTKDVMTRRNQDGTTIQVRPEHPVVNLTWWAMAAYANKLSEQRGLKPVYDFSRLEWRPGTTADDGSLEPLNPYDVRLTAKVPQEAEGYRLPSKQEQSYLIRDENGGMYGVTSSNVVEYAWLQTEQEKVFAVAGLKPIFINGSAFYDVIGNVREVSTEAALYPPTKPYELWSKPPTQEPTGWEKIKSRWPSWLRSNDQPSDPEPRVASIIKGSETRLNDQGPHIAFHQPAVHRDDKSGFRLVRSLFPVSGD